MERTQELSILVAHERLVIGQAIHRVLAAQGLRVEVVQTGDEAVAAMRRAPRDGLVLDVALPGQPVYELVALAKTGLDRPITAVVLVASVFRRTSYKRKPQQLYGADDYVEIHRLGDELPSKLWRLLAVDPSGMAGMLEAEAVLATLQAEGDQRLFDAAPQDSDTAPSSAARSARLAELIVADVILYSGDRLVATDTPAEARAAVAGELDAARELFRSVAGGASEGDPVGAAFDDLFRNLATPSP